MKNTNTESGYVSAETTKETIKTNVWMKSGIGKLIDNAIQNKVWYCSPSEFKHGKFQVSSIDDDSSITTILADGINCSSIAEHICKTHNDWLKFKQKQHSKKESKKNAEKKMSLEQRVDNLEKMIKDIWTNICADKSPVEVEDTLPTEIINKKPVLEGRKCPRCRNSKDGCEFYDKGTCRGICYLTYPPQYDPCVFEK